VAHRKTDLGQVLHDQRCPCSAASLTLIDSRLVITVLAVPSPARDKRSCSKLEWLEHFGYRPRCIRTPFSILDSQRYAIGPQPCSDRKLASGAISGMPVGAAAQQPSPTNLPTRKHLFSAVCSSGGLIDGNIRFPADDIRNSEEISSAGLINASRHRCNKDHSPHGARKTDLPLEVLMC